MNTINSYEILSYFYPMIKIKAILSALLTLLFSVSIGGAFHYCGGTLAQFKLLAGDTYIGCGTGACELSGNVTPSLQSDCCNNAVVVMSVDDYQPASKPEVKVAEITVFYTPLNTPLLSIPNSEGINLYCFNHPPENITSVDLSRIQVYLN